MTIQKIPQAGRYGVIRDLSAPEVPFGAWTNVQNVRFLDGYATLIHGEGDYFTDIPINPYYILPVTVAGEEYWIYAGEKKIYAVNILAGVSTHTNLTRQSGGVDVDYAGSPNNWTSTTLAGVPILNAGNTVDVPQRWDLNLSNNFAPLDNWPAFTYCKALRGFKQFLIAMNMTISGVNYPYMIMWSDPAEPGAVPSSWDYTDPTKLTGRYELPEGFGEIIDGLQLKDSFMVYRKDSIWRMDFVGGQAVFRFTKVIGNSGALNRNCIVEVLGNHVVLTNSDIIIHDGWQPISILDKVSRRDLFLRIDPANIHLCFLLVNPFFNEVFICYPKIGSTVCDEAMVWNYVDKTVSFRELPGIYHGSAGPISNEFQGIWSQDYDPWEIDESTWDGPEIVPAEKKVMVAMEGSRILMLDANYSNLGEVRACVLERKGLQFGETNQLNRVKSFLPKITGHIGKTLRISIGAQNTPYDDPVYTTQDFIIGTTVALDVFVTGRYIAIKIESGEAFKWKLDSYEIDVDLIGRTGFNILTGA